MWTFQGAARRRASGAARAGGQGGADVRDDDDAPLDHDRGADGRRQVDGDRHAGAGADEARPAHQALHTQPEGVHGRWALWYVLGRVGRSVVSCFLGGGEKGQYRISEQL